MPWSSYGVIGNGGFKYFYECELDPLDTAQAFRALGGRMPDSKPALDEARAAVDWDSLSLRELEQTVWRLSWDDLLPSIHAYMSFRPFLHPSDDCQ